MKNYQKKKKFQLLLAHLIQNLISKLRENDPVFVDLIIIEQEVIKYDYEFH